jgi:serpin B
MRKFGLLAAMGITFCGCSKSQSTQTTADAVVQTGAVENVAAATDTTCNRVHTANATRELWSAANNAFGFEMLRATKPGDSVVVSPYSVERAMGMLLDGACGDTAAEIQKALKLPDAGNNSQIGAEIEAEMLKTFDDKHTIDIDNHLWIQQSYALQSNYIDQMKLHYAATPESVDFAGATEDARKYINDFIAKATHDKIKEILPANAVTSLTRLILTNAVYFKGPWRNNFNESATTKADFRTAAGTQQVDMMHHTASHAVYEADQFVAFDMDFSAANYALMIVLPKADENTDVAAALADLEKGISSIVFKQIRAEMKSEQVALNMPKFRVEYGASLKELLIQLGVQSAFSTPDFSAITGNRELYLSDVLHKAFIDVNENGAEAAAATAVVMKLRSAMPMRKPISITVDHPFLFAIVEKSTQTALFLGRVTKI